MSKKNRTRRIYIIGVLVVILLIIISLFFVAHKAIAPNSQNVAAQSPTPIPTVIDYSTLSWPKDQTISAKVLMYHHVGPLPADADDIRKGLTVSADHFETGLKFLKDGNYNVTSLKKMYEMVAKGEDVSKTVVLTFDDGYDDNFIYALPIMQKYGFNGTFFIISGKVGEAEYMGQNQIKALVSAGNEIGSHTVNHLDLATLSGTKLKNEVEDSKSSLENMIGEPVVSFCYPSGKFSPQVEATVKATGYQIAVTTQKGAPFSTNNPFEIPRFRINPSTNFSSILN